MKRKKLNIEEVRYEHLDAFGTKKEVFVSFYDLSKKLSYGSGVISRKSVAFMDFLASEEYIVIKSVGKVAKICLPGKRFFDLTKADFTPPEKPKRETKNQIIARLERELATANKRNDELAQRLINYNEIPETEKKTMSRIFSR